MDLWATEMWLGTGSLTAPGQAADDLPDRHDQEQLPDHRLKHCECLPGVGGWQHDQLGGRGLAGEVAVEAGVGEHGDRVHRGGQRGPGWAR